MGYPTEKTMAQREAAAKEGLAHGKAGLPSQEKKYLDKHGDVNSNWKSYRDSYAYGSGHNMKHHGEGKPYGGR